MCYLQSNSRHSHKKGRFPYIIPHIPVLLELCLPYVPPPPQKNKRHETNTNGPPRDIEAPGHTITSVPPRPIPIPPDPQAPFTIPSRLRQGGGTRQTVGIRALPKRLDIPFHRVRGRGCCVGAGGMPVMT